MPSEARLATQQRCWISKRIFFFLVLVVLIFPLSIDMIEKDFIFLSSPLRITTQTGWQWYLESLAWGEQHEMKVLW